MEIVADVHGDCLVTNIGPRDDEIFRFESLLGAWEPVIVMGELAARRWAARQWPKAAWQSAPDDESMRDFFKIGAEQRAKKAREAQALARLEVTVVESTKALERLIERLVSGDPGAVALFRQPAHEAPKAKPK